MAARDFKKEEEALYSGKPGRWERLQVPELPFLMIDGKGAPEGPAFGKAVAALYKLAYKLKFRLKAEGKGDFAVAPLEGLWWTDPPEAFRPDRREDWLWRAMIRQPEAVTEAELEAARAEVAAKLKPDAGTDAETLAAVRLDWYAEGDCLQTLHRGRFSAEAAEIARLHDEVMPGMGLGPRGYHHEIYLNDLSRTAPDKLRTVLRQPVMEEPALPEPADP
jgi:hypothetical protein